MKRLIYVVHYPIFGGPHNQALRLAPMLERNGWHTVVALPKEPGNALSRFRSVGVEVAVVKMHRLRATADPRQHLSLCLSFASDVGRLRRLMREKHIDLVILGGLANPHAAIAARLEGIPLVWQILDTRTGPVVNSILRQFARRLADSVMFCGEALIEHHGWATVKDVPRFAYFPPVDTSRFVVSAERRARTRASLGIPDEDLVVGMVANLNPQKGIDNFVKAASLIYTAVPNSWFVLVGARHQTHRDYLDSVLDARSLGVPPARLKLVGDRSDVEYLYPSMDIHLLTSVPRSEGIPTVVLEAMACGVPTIATRVGGLAEVVDGNNGRLVPPMDSESIAQACIALWRTPDTRLEMARAARAKAESTFSLRASADVHLRAFEAAQKRSADRLGRASTMRGSRRLNHDDW